MYKLGQVAEAAGINARTLSDWLDRKIIAVPASGSGSHRTFDLHDVDRVAVVAELVRLGLPVAEAAKAASVFSDERSTGRPRGQLHGGDAKTLLVITQDGARVHRAYDKATFERAMEVLFAEDRSVIVLNVGEVTRRVDDALEGNGTPKPPAGVVFRNGREMHVA